MTTEPGGDDGLRCIPDRGTGRPILLSPRRQQRPHNTGADQDGSKDCPFCEGFEDRTTAEIDAIRRPGTSADEPGWTARAFANLYPAAARHEVIAEGPRHRVHPAQLSRDELAAALQLWRQRVAAMEQDPTVACAFWFKNVGAAAGSSIAHNHSQLIGLDEVPPRLRAEQEACESGCLHCDELATAAAGGRLITANQHFALLCPSTPKLPYETWLLPRAHGRVFCRPEAEESEALVDILAQTFARFSHAFDYGALNCWLHRLPDAGFHWHFEFQPRRGQVAALELGADMYINAVPPEQAAARLAAALPN